MSNLIRLFLFIAARVALSLAIVLWIASGIWGLTGTGRMLGFSFRAVNCTEGLAIAVLQANTESWNLEQLTPEQLKDASWVFDPSERDRQTFECWSPIPGLGYLNGMGRVMICVHHWLLLCSAGAFYGIVKLVYRRQSEE